MTYDNWLLRGTGIDDPLPCDCFIKTCERCNPDGCVCDVCDEAQPADAFTLDENNKNISWWTICEWCGDKRVCANCKKHWPEGCCSGCQEEATPKVALAA